MEEHIIDRFELASMLDGLDIRSFLHYLMQLDFIKARDEFLRFIKSMFQSIKQAEKYSRISYAKGLNPFDRSEGVEPGYYEREQVFKDQMKNFLEVKFDVHELYHKPEYRNAYKELHDYFEKAGKDIKGTTLTSNGYFKIPGEDRLIALITPEKMEELKKFAENDESLPKKDITDKDGNVISVRMLPDDAVIGKTENGNIILNLDDPTVNKFIVSELVQGHRDKDEPVKEEKTEDKEPKKEPVQEKPLSSGEKKLEKAEKSKDWLTLKDLTERQRFDPATNKDIKDILKKYTLTELKDVQVKVKAIGENIIVGQDKDSYFIKLPRKLSPKDKPLISEWDNEYLKKNLIIKVPKTNTENVSKKNNVLEIQLNVGQKYKVCNEKGENITPNGREVEVFGLLAADKFEIQAVNKTFTDVAEKHLEIDGKSVKQLTSDGFTFAYDDKRAIILNYTGDKTDIVTPKEIAIDGKTYPVDEIKDDAFAGTKIRSVTVSEGVKLLGNNSFKDCNSLKTVSLPSTLKSIGNGVFNGCVLESIEMKDNDMIRVDKGILIYKNVAVKAAVGMIEEPVVIPPDVTEIGEEAFKGFKDDLFKGEAIDLANVDTVGRSAFEDSAFRTVSGHPGYFGENAFYNSLVKDIDLSRAVSLGTKSFSQTSLVRADLASIVTMGEKVFENTSNLTDISINAENLDRTTWSDHIFDGCVMNDHIKWRNLSKEEERKLNAQLMSLPYNHDLQPSETAGTRVDTINDYKTAIKIRSQQILYLESNKLLPDADIKLIDEQIKAYQEEIKEYEKGIKMLEPESEHKEQSVNKPVNQPATRKNDDIER